LCWFVHPISSLKKGSHLTTTLAAYELANSQTFSLIANISTLPGAVKSILGGF
jgi:hypothetical protein